MTQEQTKETFSIEEIEDVRIIIKAKGKHFGIVPKRDVDREECRWARIAIACVAFDTHAVVDTPLEELKNSLP